MNGIIAAPSSMACCTRYRLVDMVRVFIVAPQLLAHIRANQLVSRLAYSVNYSIITHARPTTTSTVNEQIRRVAVFTNDSASI